VPWRHGVDRLEEATGPEGDPGGEHPTHRLRLAGGDVGVALPGPLDEALELGGLIVVDAGEVGGLDRIVGEAQGDREAASTAGVDRPLGGGGPGVAVDAPDRPAVLLALGERRRGIGSAEGGSGPGGPGLEAGPIAGLVRAVGVAVARRSTGPGVRERLAAGLTQVGPLRWQVLSPRQAPTLTVST